MIDNTKPVQLLQNIEDSDLKVVGKSVAVLARFTQEKLPIPNGFVISVYGFHQYVDLSDLKKYFINSRKEKDRSDLANAFEGSSLPPKLAEIIRAAYVKISGFTDAFVNIKGLILDTNSNEVSHRSYINYDVRGEDNIVSEVENLYKEIVLDNVNAIEKFFSGDFNIVLVVQKSVQAEASGLMQTSDLITKDNSKLIIEALYGLESGAALEGIVPDQYSFDKNLNQIREKHISTQEFMIVRQPGSAESTQKVAISVSWQKRQKIDDKHIIVLAKTGLIIEEELNEPQMVTWAYEAGKIWITFVESLYKKDLKAFSEQDLQSKVDIHIQKEQDDIEKPLDKQMLRDIILEQDQNTESKFENLRPNHKEEDKTTMNDQNIQAKREPLLEGAFGAGEEAQGEISFDPESASISNILVLKGDEDISSTLKVSGFIVEDESDILAERLHEYFKVPVITGVPLARKILKNGEKIIIDGEKAHIFELVPFVTPVEEVQMSFVKTSFAPSEPTKSIEERAGFEFTAKVNPPTAEEKLQSDNDMLTAVARGEANFYEDQKVRIERRSSASSLEKSKVKKEEISKNSEKDPKLSKFLDLVNEEVENEVEEVVNEDAIKPTDQVKGLNKGDQFKVWGKSLEKIISSSKNIAPSTALEALEHVIEDSQDKIDQSREYNFDSEESYIATISKEVEPTKKVKTDVFVPTATKVYAQVIDETLDENLENYDGVVFSSTYEPEVLFEYLEKTIEVAGDKEVLVVAPPYEEEALVKFFKLIHSLRSKGSRNVSLILPDYRNKKEIAEYKKTLSIAGLRRSSTFEIFANISRTINVFRVEELDEGIVDGVYVDLFRLKMNMLGVEKLTATTKYVEGMKNLVSYIHENMKVDGKSLVNISGFENPRKVLEHITNYRFSGIVCSQFEVSEIKNQVAKIEQNTLTKSFKLSNAKKRRK